MYEKKRIALLKYLQKNNPYPKTALNYNSVFELLIAVVLSAQTTDIAVNKATAKLFTIANTAKKIIKLNIYEISLYIKSVGLYNNKAKNIYNLSQILCDCYDGNVPNNRNLLEALPGVGRKSANIVLNVFFNQPTIAVDTHVFRVCNRTNFAVGHNVLEVEQKLLQIVPDEFKKNCHLWFMLHGRHICKAKKPLCNSCYIKNICEFKGKN
uniref:Endonuclease III n=1 Tax=Candidatus Aschnera chinzeii TaxID=1485666 RepID=A0AAT9G4Q1_9ENTR|nr:MAG: endonuclease III [Candidatus Aschnera chinzeii]